MSQNEAPEDYLRQKIDALIAQSANMFDRLGTNHLTDELAVTKNTAIQTLRLQNSQLEEKVKKLEEASPDLSPFRIEVRTLKATLKAREAEIVLLKQQLDTIRSQFAAIKESHMAELRDILDRQTSSRDFTPVVVINDRLNRSLFDANKQKLATFELRFWIMHPGERSTLELALADFNEQWPEMPMLVGPVGICLSAHTLGAFLETKGKRTDLLVGELLPGWNKVEARFQQGSFTLHLNDMKVGNVDTGLKSLDTSKDVIIGAGTTGRAWTGEVMDLMVRTQPINQSASEWRYLVGASKKWNADD